MQLDIINIPLSLTVYGFSGVVVNNDFSGMAFQLMDRMWQVVKSNNLKNKGLNIWVYEGRDFFAGVELIDSPPPDIEIERKSITLHKYAYYKHVGAYSLIRQAGHGMIDELTKKGHKIDSPYVEMYGHWTNDESKLETELLMALK